MTIGSIRAALAGIAFAATLAPAGLSAQAFGDDGFYAPRHARTARNDGYNPNEGLQPNGCVKQCPLDLNPCDPPDFKRADGRCTLDGR